MKINQTIPVLPSADFERTAQFYQLFGFQGPRNYPDYLILRCDGQEIHFFLEEGDHTYGHGHSHFSSYLRVEGLEEIYARLSAAGVKVDPPAIRPWGMKDVVVTDPDGSTLIFGEAL